MTLHDKQLLVCSELPHIGERITAFRREILSGWLCDAALWLDGSVLENFDSVVLQGFRAAAEGQAGPLQGEPVRQKGGLFGPHRHLPRS